ncbi:TniQ family protein [Kitasatospora sp. NPDC094015]|uniref:TniQ family protein n=1 Tax=Kitasatospora sp. NPDC094015 TaxID=3155205 RepID=UPI00331D324C
MTAQTRWRPRRLPAVPVPLEGESLHSWLAALARLNETGIGPVMAALHLPASANPGFALRKAVRGLTAYQTGAVAAATGLPEDRVSRLTFASYLSGLRKVRPLPDGLPERPRTASIDIHEKNHADTIRRDHIVPDGQAKVCPSCIDEDDGRWPLAWMLPWSVVCPRHHRFLVAACECGARPRALGCLDGRNWTCPGRKINGRLTACGQLLRDLPAGTFSDPALADAQAWLLQLLDPLGERGEAEGVTPDDVNAMVLLCTERGFVTNLAGLDPPVKEAFETHMRTNERNMWRRGGSSRGRRGYSPDPHVIAAGLRMAVAILAADDPLEEARRFLPVDIAGVMGVRAISDWLRKDTQWTAMSLVGPRYVPLAAAVLNPEGARVPRTGFMLAHPRGRMSLWSAFDAD